MEIPFERARQVENTHKGKWTAYFQVVLQAIKKIDQAYVIENDRELSNSLDLLNI